MAKQKKSTRRPARSPKPPMFSPLDEFRGTADRSAEFAKISKSVGRDARAERAFVDSKFHMLRTHPIFRAEERESAIKQLKKVVKVDVLKAVKQPPVPGGVGYGMF